MLHAVLADLVAAALRVPAQRHVVVGAAGEVLQQVAVGLGRHHPQVHVQAGVGGGGQFRLALGLHPGQFGQGGEGGHDGGRLQSRPPPDRCRRWSTGSGAGCRRSRRPPPAGRARSASTNRAAWGSTTARSRRPLSCPAATAVQVSMARRMFASVFSPMPGSPRSRPSRAAFSRSRRSATPACSHTSRGLLGPHPGQAHDRQQPFRVALAQLGEELDVPGGHVLQHLLLDGLAHARAAAAARPAAPSRPRTPGGSRKSAAAFS